MESILRQQIPRSLRSIDIVIKWALPNMQVTRLRPWPFNGPALSCPAKTISLGIQTETQHLWTMLGRNRLNSVTRLKFRIGNLARLSLPSRFQAWLKLPRPRYNVALVLITASRALLIDAEVGARLSLALLLLTPPHTRR